MRTTLTLDDDVYVLLRRIQENRGLSFRAAVNGALREGLRSMEKRPRSRKRHRTRSISLGGCRLPSLDDVAEVLALGEGEAFR